MPGLSFYIPFARLKNLCDKHASHAMTIRYNDARKPQWGISNPKQQLKALDLHQVLSLLQPTMALDLGAWDWMGWMMIRPLGAKAPHAIVRRSTLR